MKSIFKRLAAVFCCGVFALSLTACGGEENAPKNGKKLLDHAKEISNEVDKVLLTSEIQSATGAVSPTATTAASATNGNESGIVAASAVSEGMTDVTDPADNEAYQEYLVSGRLTMDSTYTRLSNGDNFVKIAKSVKQKIVDSVTQLNTWITEAGSAYERYRLNYDPLNDVVLLESVENVYLALYGGYDLNYYYIRAARSEDGKALIEVSYTDTSCGDLNFRSSLRFFEDDVWIYTNETKNPDTGELIRNVIYSDLRKGDIVSLTADQVALRRRGDVNSYMVRPGEEGKEQTVLYADNAAGERVADYFIYSEVAVIDPYAYIDLYELTGWKKLYSDGYSNELVLSDDRVVTSTGQTAELDGFTLEYKTYQSGCPYIRLEFEDLRGDKTLSQRIDSALEYLGLWYKDTSVREVFRGYDDLEAYQRSFNVFDGDGMVVMNEEKLDELFYELAFDSPTVAELQAMTEAPSVRYKDQKVDKAYYEIYSISFDGTATFDSENGIFDLSALTVSAQDNILLEKGGEYALCIALCDEFSSILLSEATAVWKSGELTVTGLNSYDVKTAPVGEYRLIVYLAKKTKTGENTRISDKLPVTVSSASTACFEAEGKTVSVEATEEKISIVVRENTSEE